MVLDWVREQRERMGADLRAAHAVLVARAEEEDPELAERLSPEPPQPMVWGYGVVPELRENAPLKSIAATEMVYSIESLSTMFPGAFRDAAVLARRAQDQPTLPLKAAALEYLRLKERLANLDQRIAYHEFWQKDIVRARGWYDGRNAIVALARQRRVLAQSGQFPDKVAELTAEIIGAVAPFAPQEALVVERVENGERVLRVRVATDIEDAAFLEAFRAAVDETWSQSEAARSLRFRIVLELETIAPVELYPEGPPERASPVDLDQHLARFPEGFKVLTTGARSLHSGKGYVQLGPTAVMPRVLAHEFGHLLGFVDAYLRGYEGDPDGPFGVRVVEWTGLMDNLMGGPAAGRVTREMIEQLLAAYDPDR